MFKKCPLFPEAITTHQTGRQMDCPHTVCKFNIDQTCQILQSAIVVRDLSDKIHSIMQLRG